MGVPRALRLLINKFKIMKGKYLNASILALAFVVGGVGVSSAYGGLGNGDSTRPELTDAQKTVLDQMHDLRMDGKFDEANALREQSGLPQMGRGRGQSAEMQAHREVVQTALENNDYQAFLTAIDGTPREEGMTPEIFAKMREAHTLREAGDFDGARAIMDELGIGGKGFGKGGMRGNCPNNQ